jgi:hypothetical protein
VVGIGELSGERGPSGKGEIRFGVRYLSRILDDPVGIEELRSDPVIGGADFLRAGPSGTVFPLSGEQGRHLYVLLSARNSSIVQVWPDATVGPANPGLSEFCIYTIKHSNELRASYARGGRDTYTEKKQWTTAGRLLADAKRADQRLPVVFAPAEGTSHLFAWGLLDSIRTINDSTEYAFSDLRVFNHRPAKSTLRKRDGEPLGEGFIRPYAICVTPAYLHDLLAELGPAADTDIGEEKIPAGTFPEGAVRVITVNAYERNPEARRICLQHYGMQCAVCGMTFAERYGSVADGFIHVHHLRLLSSVGPDDQVDPVVDLRPVCPNCHAVIHLRTPPYSIEEVREMESQPVSNAGAENETAAECGAVQGGCSA